MKKAQGGKSMFGKVKGTNEMSTVAKVAGGAVDSKPGKKSRKN
jgi:hypothetical protein